MDCTIIEAAKYTLTVTPQEYRALFTHDDGTRPQHNVVSASRVNCIVESGSRVTARNADGKVITLNNKRVHLHDKRKVRRKRTTHRIAACFFHQSLRQPSTAEQHIPPATLRAREDAAGARMQAATVQGELYTRKQAPIQPARRYAKPAQYGGKLITE